MSPPPHAMAHANRLLGRLDSADRACLVAACEPIELQAGQVLQRPGLRTMHAWFPLDTVVSLGLAAPGRPQPFEVALVGREGVVGVGLLLASPASPLWATAVQPGAALRIGAHALGELMHASEPLRLGLQRYVHASLAQLAQAALCSRYHLVEQRLARWLLTMEDGAPHAALHATHEMLAAALGARRAGITHAAASLQRRGLISYRRGVLHVLDRAGLQAAACACHAADRASYAKAMRGAFQAPSPGRTPR